MVRHIVFALIAFALLGSPLAEAASAQMTIGRDGACETATTRLASEQPTWTDATIAVYTGCTRSSAGDWVWPEAGSDSRLVEPVSFDASEAKARADAIDELNLEIDALLESAGTIADVIIATANTCSYGSGLTSVSVARFTVPLRDAYVRLIETAASSTPNSLVAQYIAWWQAERMSTRPAGWDALNAQTHSAMEARYEWSRTPWPFELRQGYAQDRFIRHLIDSDKTG